MTTALTFWFFAVVSTLGTAALVRYAFAAENYLLVAAVVAGYGVGLSFAFWVWATLLLSSVKSRGVAFSRWRREWFIWLSLVAACLLMVVIYGIEATMHPSHWVLLPIFVFALYAILVWLKERLREP